MGFVVGSGMFKGFGGGEVEVAVWFEFCFVLS